MAQAPQANIAQEEKMAEPGAGRSVRGAQWQERDDHELADSTLPVGTCGSIHGSPVVMETPLSRLQPTLVSSELWAQHFSRSMKFKGFGAAIRLALRKGCLRDCCAQGGRG